MLVLTAEETSDLLQMSDVIATLEPLYRDAVGDNAGNGPRVDLTSPGGPPGGVYTLKSMTGVAPRYHLSAVRIASDTILWEESGTGWRRKKIPMAGPGCWVGLVLLFDTRTGKPEAVFADGYAQRVRTAAANAVAAKYLARDDTRVMGLIGTGWQAGAQVEAMLAVRDIQRVQVWSPNSDHCSRFAAEMARRASTSVVPVEDAGAAVRGADLVCTAVSASEVLTSHMVEAGQFLTNVRASEFSPDVYEAADRIVVHLKEEDRWVRAFGGAVVPPAAPAKAQRAQAILRGAPFLQDVVSGRSSGRQSSDEVTVFVNNFGGGMQFAAVGEVLLKAAKAKGTGRDIPDDWFLQNVPT